MSKTILIVGSSGGLGQVISNWFASRNFKLALHYLEHEPTIKSDNLKKYKADITIESEVKKMIDQVIADFGKIDIVINNAGVSKSEISWKTSSENWDHTLAVNLNGPFYVAKYVLPHMRENGFGRIIFMSSIVAQTGFIGTSAYAASKAGLIGLTKTLAKEVASKNITVNAIAPGYFSAGMINDVTTELQEQLKKQIPVGSLGNPEEIAALIEYIISDNASYLTGQAIGLNGGLDM
ncbi:MAG: 3-oxoacyl-ACP reductase FabG [Crocinitomicaceae bacterium]|nr:3-oxoacyl-ACP reductase FabG [Crocinitomicaceae bacterium]